MLLNYYYGEFFYIIDYFRWYLLNFFFKKCWTICFQFFFFFNVMQLKYLLYIFDKKLIYWNDKSNWISRTTH
jgi:hypothetical protein